MESAWWKQRSKLIPFCVYYLLSILGSCIFSGCILKNRR